MDLLLVDVLCQATPYLRSGSPGQLGEVPGGVSEREGGHLVLIHVLDLIVPVVYNLLHGAFSSFPVRTILKCQNILSNLKET